MSHHNSNTTKQPKDHFSSTKRGRKLFLSFFRRNPGLMTIALTLMVVNIFLVLLPAVLIGRSLNLLINQGYGKQFIFSVFLLLIVAILSYLTSAISNYAFSVTAFATERDVRNEFYYGIINSSMQFHDRNDSSILLSLGMNEIHFLAAGSMMTGVILRSMISTTMVVIYIYPLIDLLPSLVTIVGFIFYFVYVYRYAKEVVPIRRNVSQTLAYLSKQSQEVFKGIEVIRSMGSENNEMNRFRDINKKNALYSEQEGKLRAFYIPGLLLLAIISFIFTIGVFRVFNGFIEITQLVEIIGLLIILQTINFTIPNIILAIRGGILNADRIASKIYEAESMKLKELQGKKLLGKVETIEFKDVTFAYPGVKKANLKQLNFKIDRGQSVVLLGGPGSGKSSIMKLLLRLYRPQHGSIEINGVEIEHFDQKSLRSKMSMVEQEVYLFKTSIRENIGFGRSEVSDNEIKKAANMARATEFIDKLQSGLDTKIGERGVTLSGGQRQRLAIARAIMTHPEILLLDDSTSALDAKTEQSIFKSLKKIKNNITTLSIAHRVNIIKEADLILFLQKGSLIGLGDHNTLYHQNETYQWMFDILEQQSIENSKKKKIAERA